MCGLFLAGISPGSSGAEGSSAERAPGYTFELLAGHIENISKNPGVSPTPSGDSRFIIGQSAGCRESGIPSHALYAYMVTRDISDEAENGGEKLSIVLMGGQHPGEHTGHWALQGAVDFLLSGDERADELLRKAVFYVYPMVNPDGFISGGKGSPEIYARGFRDHNRVWHTSGEFSTIDAFKEAIIADTGGFSDYFLDFHSYFRPLEKTCCFFFATNADGHSPYGLAMRERGHNHVLRLLFRGRAPAWVVSEDGIRATYAFTPEVFIGHSKQESLDIGREYMLGFHDLLTGAAPESVEPERKALYGRVKKGEAALGGNLVSNPGFENVDEDGVPAGYVRPQRIVDEGALIATFEYPGVDDERFGKRSGWMKGVEGRAWVLTSARGVVPGRFYLCEVDVKFEPAQYSSDAHAYLRIQWLGGAGWIRGRHTYYSNLSYRRGQWDSLRTIAVAPEGADRAQVYLHVENITGEEEAFFDNLSVRKVFTE